MHITVQTRYDIQYLIMRLSGYINAPTEPAFLALRHGMEYFMYQPHEPITYSRNNVFKLNESLSQCVFKTVSAEINKTH